MPCKPQKARQLLKQKKAKVVKKTPFTIQMLYGSSGYKQEVSVGVDAGSKHIGLSATTKDKVLFETDVELRNDIVTLISERSMFRRERRLRKTRYRKPRRNNRSASKQNGWIAPSIRNKIDSHHKVIEDTYKMLPVSKLIVETASFDIQKLMNPSITNYEYALGEQHGFSNIREYVLFRDNHKCRCCKGKSKEKILQVHHIESRKTGGNAPNNLITLCRTCHEKYHNGEIKLPVSIKRGQKQNHATFMGIMRKSLMKELKEKYPNVSETYGYLTKNTRIENCLPKEHYIDARCISGNPNAKSDGIVYYQKKVRCHNRKIHQCKIAKGGKRKVNQAPYEIFGFRLWDKVFFRNQECFVYGRRTRGEFLLKKLDGSYVADSVKHHRIKLLEKAKHLLIERRFVSNANMCST